MNDNSAAQAPSSQDRSSIIEMVKTPLGFTTLSLLVVEVLLLRVVSNRDDDIVTFLLVALMAVQFVVVFWVALVRPEALYGERPAQDEFHLTISNAMFLVMDGSLRNLPEEDRVEAWNNLLDTLQFEIDDVDAESKSHRRRFFRKQVKAFRNRLSRTVAIGANSRSPGGPTA
ncbi:MAG: hypothetical protein AAGA39_03685 [Pseudomonadota bacterium]